MRRIFPITFYGEQPCIPFQRRFFPGLPDVSGKVLSDEVHTQPV